MSLELILGCMQSGKSTELIRRVRVQQSIGKSVLVINHAIEAKSYNADVPEGIILTHDNSQHTAMSLHTLAPLFQDAERLHQDIQAINEGQFFGDLKEGVLRLVEEQGKRVIVCGLDGDFRRHSFGQILELIPYADSYEKWRALCAVCRNGREAPFSGRVRGKEGAGQVAVCGEAEYLPMCRECYLTHESHAH